VAVSSPITSDIVGYARRRMAEARRQAVVTKAARRRSKVLRFKVRLLMAAHQVGFLACNDDCWLRPPRRSK
jgi:hypothetical protein